MVGEAPAPAVAERANRRTVTENRDFAGGIRYAGITFVSTASGGRVGPQTIFIVRRGGHATLGSREEHE